MTINVHKITDMATHQRVAKAAMADNHISLCPSHFFERNGEIIGKVSAASLPVLVFWSKTSNSTRTSVELTKLAEQEMRKQGLTHWVTVCPVSSPFFVHMPRFGYQHLGSTDLFLKHI